MTLAQGKELLEQCQRNLYYYDKQAGNRIQFAVVTKEGIQVESPYVVSSEWHNKDYLRNTNEFERSMRLQEKMIFGNNISD